MSGARRKTESRTKIARLRKAQRMTQRELAEATGLSLSTVQRFDRGAVRDPSFRDLVALQRALGCRDLDDIVEAAWLRDS